MSKNYNDVAKLRTGFMCCITSKPVERRIKGVIIKLIKIKNKSYDSCCKQIAKQANWMLLLIPDLLTQNTKFNIIPSLQRDKEKNKE